MATDLENLVAEKSAILAKLRAMAEAPDPFNVAGAKPNASGGAAAIDHGEYHRRWRERLREIDEAIAAAEFAADGAWELDQELYA